MERKKIPWWALLLTSMAITSLIYCATFYIHEFGHSLFGPGDEKISNWTDCPVCSIIPIPQQTAPVIGGDTLLFRIGGSLFLIGWAISLSLIILKRREMIRPLVLATLLVLTADEVLRNVICGTDNPIHGPYSICGNILVYVAKESISILAIIMIFITTFYWLKTAVGWKLTKCQKVTPTQQIKDIKW